MNESNVGGKLEQVLGKVKQGIGEALGNEKLANKGAADQVTGHAKEAWGNVKDTASDLHDDAAGRASAKADEKEHEAHEKGGELRDSIVNTAEHAKESINRGLDHLKGDKEA